MKKFILAAALLAIPALLMAQVYPSIPPNTVLGRLGAGQAGQPQPIPIASLFQPPANTGNVNTQSGNYQIVPGDCWGTVVATGALAAITVPSTALFPANCSVHIVNRTAGRGIRIIGVSSQNFMPGCGGSCLLPGLSFDIDIESGAFAITRQPPPFWQANGAFVYFDPSGSNTANDCLAASSPCATLTHAWTMAQTYMSGIGALQFVCSGSTLNENALLAGVMPGEDATSIIGNAGNPGGCHIHGANTSATIECTDHCTIQPQGLFVDGGSPTWLISQHSTADQSNNDFGDCGAGGGVSQLIGADGVENYTGPNNWVAASSNCGSFISALEAGAEFVCNGETLTITGTIAMGASSPIFQSVGPSKLDGPCVFSGSVTSALQFNIQRNGVFSQGGMSYPSGSTAGSSGTGAQVY